MLRRAGPASWALAVSLCASGRARALGPATESRDIVDIASPAARIFSEKDGLPQNTITAIAQDADGYLWVGTVSGPAYYDGRRWIAVSLPNRDASTFVRAIVPARGGGLWIGTEGGGLCRLKDRKWSVVDAPLPSRKVRSIVETADTLWVGTEGGGIARLRFGAWSVLSSATGLPDDRVYSLLVTTSTEGETLWAGTYGGGVGRYRDGAWTTIDTRSGLPSNVVNSLAATRGRDGSVVVWAGTDGGVARLEDGRVTATFDKASGAFRENLVRALLNVAGESGSGTLYAASLGGGLYRLEGDRWQAVPLPTDRLRALHATLTPGGLPMLWVGSEYGLVVPNLRSWKTVDKGTGLPRNEVRAMLETSSGGGAPAFVFCTNGGGVARYERGVFEVDDVSTGLPSNSATAVLETGTGGGRALWVGTFGGGLARRDGSRWTVFTSRNGLPDDKVTCLLEAGPEDGRELWIGTYGGGVTRTRDGTFRPLPHLPNGKVGDILESVDAAGRRTVWVATLGGLCRVDADDQVTVLDRRSGFPSDSVLSLHQAVEPSGRRTLWVGTQGGGVIRFDPDERPIRPVVLSDTTTPALPSGIVYQIRQDAAGRVYLFTSKGVVRLTAGAKGLELRTFTTEDGLPGNQCTYQGAYVDRRGRIWAGTSEGAAVLDPALELADRSVKPLHLERAVITRSGQPITAGAALSHADANVLFEWALLSYTHEGETRYRTQLVGFDPEPSAWSRDWKREYTNLPARRYVFRAWGVDHAGNLSGPVELRFSVRPAPWATWWALLGYGALLAGSIYGAIRLRLAALRKRTEQLEETVAQRTAELARARDEALSATRMKSSFLASVSHELRTPLNAILGYSELLLEEADELKAAGLVPKLENIRSAAGHQLGVINEILDLSKIEAGRMSLVIERHEVAELVRGVETTMRPLLEKGGNAFTVRCAPGLGSMWTDGQRVRQALLNLLSNAAKFTQHGTVALEVERSGDDVLFRVTDSGVGMTAEQLARLFQPFMQAEAATSRTYGGTGLGLAITRQLCQLMGGDVLVASTPGEGSTFTIRLPVSQTPEGPAGARTAPAS